MSNCNCVDCGCDDDDFIKRNPVIDAQINQYLKDNAPGGIIEDSQSVILQEIAKHAANPLTK